MLIGFDGAKIQQFPDIPAVSAEILALRGWEGEKKRAAIRLPGLCIWILFISSLGLHKTMNPYNAYKQGKLVDLPFLGSIYLETE